MVEDVEVFFSEDLVVVIKEVDANSSNNELAATEYPAQVE